MEGTVAAGTSFRQDEADVTVGCLSGAGTVDMSVTLGANGVLETTLANDFSDNALACTGTLTLPAIGTLRVDADWEHLAAFGGEAGRQVMNFQDLFTHGGPLSCCAGRGCPAARRRKCWCP